VFAPFLLLLLVVWFGFVGCGGPDFESEPDPMPVPYKDVVANTPGFAAHWPLDETSGNTAFVNGPLAPGAHGTYNLAGVTLADDPVGALAQEGNVAPLFAGTNGYVEVPYVGVFNPTAALSFSVELWMKPQASAGGANQMLISSRQGVGNERRGYEIGFVLEQNQTQPIVRARVFAPNVNESEVSVPLSQQGDPSAWRHVVCVYDGSAGPKLALSVGVIGLAEPVKIENSANVAYEPVSPQGSTLLFGAGQTQDGGAQSFFAGWLDEIAFYNAALTDGQIKEHFTKATAPS
jgi:hypothetical protein